MRVLRILLVVLAASLVLAACEADPDPNNPTPAPWTGVAADLGAAQILFSDVRSGDPGCTDQELARTAVSFLASGFDQSQPTRVYLYSFRNKATFDRLRTSVDTCARAYITDSSVYGSIDATPFVAVGAGPWAPEFASHLRQAITTAAGKSS